MGKTGLGREVKLKDKRDLMRLEVSSVPGGAYLSGFCPGSFVYVFVSCLYVCFVLELEVLFVFSMCSFVPASLFPCTLLSG